MKKITTLVSILLLTLSLSAQQMYSIDASGTKMSLETGRFKMGNSGTKGKELEVNNLYMTIAGKPILPIMGEMHYSRIEPEQWEDCLLKMKACGVNIVSTYLFWNHHEEIEGQFDWESIKNLRNFIRLCQKHDMYTYPRIGPWSHGEARNGGTPDWILRKQYLKDRSNDPVYQSYVTKYFREVANQLKGLYYKDGGNVIGIQLENEYWYAKEGEPHIQWLKDTAKSLGMDVPLYTVTGWGGGSVPPFEVIPLWGGYADEPWIEKVTKDVLPFNFMFDSFRDNKHIGNDQIDHKEEYMSYESYPYFTCEMGVGVPQMYHRRTVVSPIDGYGMMIAKLGSGSNLLGYYVFAGGTNPRGLLHGTEEEQEETGYWCRVPAKSYDFQAAIKESGELAKSYYQVKKLHYFINDFGNELAPMMPVITKKAEDNLQLAVRSDNRSGYLFGINYCRYIPKKISDNIKFSVKFEDETIEFPQQGINIVDSTIFIWPMNLKIKSALLKYATAQLLCKTDDAHIFFQNKDIKPEFAFDNTTINDVSATGANIIKKGNLTIVNVTHAGKDCVINLNLKDGTNRHIIVLTEKEADNAWLLSRNGKKEFYISNANMYIDGNDLYALTTANNIHISSLKNGKFVDSDIAAEQKKSEVKLIPHNIFDDTQWLESADFKDLPDYMQRYHRFFFKEFSLENPSKVRKATLYIYPETAVSLNINEAWVRQDIKAKQLNAIDITGYVAKGNNMLYLDFPYIEGKARFAARVIVEYGNYDRVEFSTDLSWLKTDMYTTPSPTKSYSRPEKAIVAATPDYSKNITYSGFSEWNIKVPYGAFDSLSALYTHLNYTGDRAELYNGHMLCSDNFNDNTPWQIGLQRINEAAVEGKELRLVIYPLAKETKLFFDIMPGPADYGKMSIEKFEIKPESKIKIN